jgi:hypothetical protein
MYNKTVEIQVFSYYFCLKMEGSGSAPLKKLIRIREAQKPNDPDPEHWYILSQTLTLNMDLRGKPTCMTAQVDRQMGSVLSSENSNVDCDRTTEHTLNKCGHMHFLLIGRSWRRTNM